MKKILFATTNKRKLNEAKAAFKDFGIKVDQIELDINEIQSKDAKYISLHKAESAFRLVHKPVVITDTSWKIPSLKGFPGGYMKDISSWFEPEDFINLIKNKNDKRISFTECIVYKDSLNTKIFSEEYWGIISDKPRGKGNSIERVAEFKGFTIAEKYDNGEFSHDPKEYVWYSLAKWYSKYNIPKLEK